MALRAGWVLQGAASSVLVCALAAGCSDTRTTSRPVAFTRVVSASDSLTLRVSAEACKAQPYRVVVQESAEVVRVALTAQAHADGPALACSDLVTVPLDAPLGSRTVVDASTRATVTVQEH